MHVLILLNGIINNNMIILMNCTFEYMQRISMFNKHQAIEFVNKNKIKEINDNIQYIIIDDNQQ